jgi:hypothetical protein
MIQNHWHVDLLSGKVHAVTTRATKTAADAATIIRDMPVCLRSGAGFPYVLVVQVDRGHDSESKFRVTSEVFRAFVKSIMMGSCRIVGSAYHKNTNERRGSYKSMTAGVHI